MNIRFDKKLFDQIEKEEMRGLKGYIKRRFKINFKIQEESKK